MTRRDGWIVTQNGDHEYTVDGKVKARLYVERFSLTDNRVDYYVIVVYGDRGTWDWDHLPPVKKWQAGRKAVAQELRKRAVAQAI